MAAGPSERQALPAEHRDGLVVEDPAVGEEAVVAVARVGIEGDVADDPHAVAGLAADRAHRPGGEVVVVAGVRGVVALVPALDDRKECDRRDPEGCRLGRRPHDSLDRESLDARHRPHRHGRRVVVDKQRPDEVSRRQDRLGREAPQPGVLADPPRTGGGKGGAGWKERFWHGKQRASGRIWWGRARAVSGRRRQSRCPAAPAAARGSR